MALNKCVSFQCTTLSSIFIVAFLRRASLRRRTHASQNVSANTIHTRWLFIFYYYFRAAHHYIFVVGVGRWLFSMQESSVACRAGGQTKMAARGDHSVITSDGPPARLILYMHMWASDSRWAFSVLFPSSSARFLFLLDSLGGFASLIIIRLTI